MKDIDLPDVNGIKYNELSKEFTEELKNFRRFNAFVSSLEYHLKENDDPDKWVEKYKNIVIYPVEIIGSFLYSVKTLFNSTRYNMDRFYGINLEPMFNPTHTEVIANISISSKKDNKDINLIQTSSDVKEIIYMLEKLIKLLKDGKSNVGLNYYKYDHISQNIIPEHIGSKYDFSKSKTTFV